MLLVYFVTVFREGHYKTTGLLLERYAQVNVPSGSNDDTPLTLACWKGKIIFNSDFTSLLLMKTMLPNIYNQCSCR